MTKPFEERIKQYRSHLESFLTTWYDRFHEDPQVELFEAMKYSLFAGGKRIRPILCFEFCRLCGAKWWQATPLSAAVEMIHTYSLIHDDLPSMDNDDYRRGRLTNHKVYGEAMAILAGDALLTDAFRIVSGAPLTGVHMGNAVGILAECAGSCGMVGGQVLDIQSEKRLLTEQEVLDIQTRKTGALIRAACCCGVQAAGGTVEQHDAAAAFANNLGLAFQIRDDMLDVIGDAKELGKATGVDQTKNTFVRLYGLETCEDLVHEYTQKAIDAISIFEDTDFLVDLANELVSRKA